LFNTIVETFKDAIYIKTFSYTVLIPILIRSGAIYIFGITFSRFNKKLIGIRTPFNFILFVMLGALAANAILYKKFFLLIVSSITFLTILNGLVTLLAYYFKPIENFVKGDLPELVKDGKIQWKAMKKNFITERELRNELHTQLKTNDLSNVISAHLASDGTINFITK